MPIDPKNSLPEAVAYFKKHQFFQAYKLLRRFFDRMPFEAEKKHTEYISLFARCLLELGKQRELEFYMRVLEKNQERKFCPETAFTLSVIYAYSDFPKRRQAKELLERVLNTVTDAELIIRSKMLLAHFYSVLDDKTSSVRTIRSIEETPKDPTNQKLLTIWRAIILGYLHRFDEALNILHELLETLSCDDDWYPYFSAKHALARILIEDNRLVESARVLKEIKELQDRFRFKVVKKQVQFLEEMLNKSIEQKKLLVTEAAKKTSVRVDKNSLNFTKKSPVEKLFRLFASKRVISPRHIIQTIYSREYDQIEDDKLIEKHIRDFRKKMIQLGLPEHSLYLRNNSYALIPEAVLSRSEI